ncbi:hypothetical protein PBRA_001572 [Plasmodiophora brassicae]|nr:hypothetical protein PBRA_001572 [Plasmodiophora brassicae]
MSVPDREDRRLVGLVAPAVQSRALQVQRCLRYLDAIDDRLQRFAFMQRLHSSDVDLFYMLLMTHPDTILPIVYTPAVGLACQQWSHMYFEPQGLYVPISARGAVRKVVDNWPGDEVDVVVFTDGGRILGLGDLGANGMGIPIGKLALYVAFAGISPRRVLPVCLDVGTDNEQLLNDDLYIGLKQRRSATSFEEYDAFVGEFMDAMADRFGRTTLMQFEDFGTQTALYLLGKYRSRFTTFNDDVQGTAVMTLAGVMSSLPLLASPHLHEQRIVFFGAGSAGIGIADMISKAISVSGGISFEEARRRVWAVDSRGLIVANRPGRPLEPYKQGYAHEHEHIKDLLDIVNAIRPSILIGVSSQAGAFNEQILAAMAMINKRPVVFALSNPTSQSECTAEMAIVHTEGRALFASGSPFPPVTYRGKEFDTSQANNVYVFPGIGLGALASQALQISDDMMVVAAKALSSLVTDADRERGNLFPPMDGLRRVSARIGTAVAEAAFRSGLASIPRPDDVSLAVRRTMVYDPTQCLVSKM